ncbi:hypothetical protein BT96DRAFT_1060110, partial [Gymnopus androsaceus JB14]
MLPEACTPICPDQSIWPKVRNMVVTPPGFTEQQAWEKHSMVNIFIDWTPKHPRQIIPHRGRDIPAVGIPDGSEEAILLATSGDGVGNNAECDIVYTNNEIEEPIVQHDLAADRQSTLSGHWDKIELSEELPSFIQRDPEGDQLSSKYI